MKRLSPHLPDKRSHFLTKERDEESGLYYYGARYYAGWLCRFVSVDPLEQDYPYYTPYQYAGNKPITFVDLDGLEESEPPFLNGDGHAFIKNTYSEVPNYHVVQSGDTYWGLAKQYGVTPEELENWNKYEATKIPIGTALAVSNPNKEVIEIGSYYQSSEGDSINISFFYSKNFFDQDEVIDSYSSHGNFSIPVQTGKGKMSASEQRTAIIYDAVGLTASIIGLSAGIAMLGTGAATPAGLALTVASISVISGIIGVGGFGAKIGADIVNTPKSNRVADAVPTNLLSLVTLPIDVARKDSSLSVSKTAGMVEDGVFFFMRPKASGAEVKKVGNLFDKRAVEFNDFFEKSLQGASIYGNFQK